jgi:Arc/MetJ-type ribon-helix-helix transcriptional regulator
MTMTVKLPAHLEQTLRQRSAAAGRPASELIREALQLYLADSILPDASAYALGNDLFGRHDGPVDLSTQRKKVLADIWAEKHDRRSAKRRP